MKPINIIQKLNESENTNCKSIAKKAYKNLENNCEKGKDYCIVKYSTWKNELEKYTDDISDELIQCLRNEFLNNGWEPRIGYNYYKPVKGKEIPEPKHSDGYYFDCLDWEDGSLFDDSNVIKDEIPGVTCELWNSPSNKTVVRVSSNDKDKLIDWINKNYEGTDSVDYYIKRIKEYK